MRVGSTIFDIEQEIALIMKQAPGPYWFGPRLDFNNAVFQLPMPEHLAAWWHPGTAFPRKDVSRLLDIWRAQQFQTLVFLSADPRNDNIIYYPQEFLDLIHRDYIADERYPFLTVYHRRSGVTSRP